MVVERKGEKSSRGKESDNNSAQRLENVKAPISPRRDNEMLLITEVKEKRQDERGGNRISNMMSNRTSNGIKGNEQGKLQTAHESQRSPWPQARLCGCVDTKK